MSFEEYYDLVKRIENLENSNMGDFMLIVPICALALVLLVFTLYAIGVWLDNHKKN